MRVAKLVSMVAFSSFTPNEAIDFFIGVLRNRERLGLEASMCIDIDITEMRIRLGHMQDAKEFIDETKDKIQKENFSEAIVYSKFYKVLGEYHKVF
jgi:hypothetical protein